MGSYNIFLSHSVEDYCLASVFVDCQLCGNSVIGNFVLLTTHLGSVLVNNQFDAQFFFRIFFFFFFHWHRSPLWALACRTIPLHFSLSITNSLHLLTPSTLRSLSASSLHPFLGLPLRLVPSSSSVKIFLVILSSSILSR